jgi:hypothetical protein
VVERVLTKWQEVVSDRQQPQAWPWRQATTLPRRERGQQVLPPARWRMRTLTGSCRPGCRLPGVAGRRRTRADWRVRGWVSPRGADSACTRGHRISLPTSPHREVRGRHQVRVPPSDRSGGIPPTLAAQNPPPAPPGARSGRARTDWGSDARSSSAARGPGGVSATFGPTGVW